MRIGLNLSSLGPIDILSEEYFIFLDLSSWLRKKQIIFTFIKIRFEFISTECENLVRRTNTVKSKSLAEWNSSFSVFGVT